MLRVGCGVLLLGSWLAVCAASSGCSKPSAKKSGALEPLTETSWLVAIGDRGGRVAVPLGAREPRPIVIALHGSGDRPEWACGSYRHVSSSRAFVLCPAGDALPDGRFTPASLEQTGAELRKSLQALKARFGAHVAPGPVVLAAIGPAVAQVLEIALQEPAFFSYLVLVDGDAAALTTPRLARFGSVGGRRILWACTQPSCESELEPRLRTSPPAGVQMRWLHPKDARALDANMVRELTREFSWLVSSDRRFIPARQ